MTAGNTGGIGTVTNATSIMTRLRAETRTEHEQAEQRPLEQALVSGRLSRAQYVDYLGERWPIHERLEQHVGDLLRQDARLAGLIPSELLQTPNLSADLSFFGLQPAPQPASAAAAALCTDIERISQCRPIALLGVYYVFEGSKNGARYAARAVRGALQLDGDGVRYLDPHGPAQRDLWNQFKERMDALSLTSDEQDEIVAAAKLTFRRIGELDDELWAAGHAAA